jgi:hypothetical protein
LLLENVEVVRAAKGNDPLVHRGDLFLDDHADGLAPNRPPIRQAEEA